MQLREERRAEALHADGGALRRARECRRHDRLRRERLRLSDDGRGHADQRHFPAAAAVALGRSGGMDLDQPRQRRREHCSLAVLDAAAEPELDHHPDVRRGKVRGRLRRHDDRERLYGAAADAAVGCSG